MSNDSQNGKKDDSAKKDNDTITRHISRQPVPKDYVRSDFPPPKPDKDKGEKK